jgi:hypothetical protein
MPYPYDPPPIGPDDTVANRIRITRTLREFENTYTQKNQHPVGSPQFKRLHGKEEQLRKELSGLADLQITGAPDGFIGPI